ncbi:hypothetical protein [uncultured Arcobacter sp.]|uniref:hypothetical protein n=1 Tax=uncultured Arcobacter sp. TaxID=165434 RepID=UPI00260B0865|nr:hypothetical protein [uncultured Arcobacter sp.]
MIINLSKIKTEALLLLCKDLISSYENSEDIDFSIDKNIKDYIDEISKDILKELKKVTRDNDFYIKNKSSSRIKSILKAYNFINKELSLEFQDSVEFNPSMLYISLLAMWFKELEKESKSKEYIYFLIYPYSNVYDKLLLNIKDEKFRNLNIKMIDIAERVILKYDKYLLK